MVDELSCGIASVEVDFNLWALVRAELLLDELVAEKQPPFIPVTVLSNGVRAMLLLLLPIRDLGIRVELSGVARTRFFGLGFG